MRNSRKILFYLLFAITISLNLPKNVLAVELLTNGGFETGAAAPWVIQYSGCTDNGASYSPIGVKAIGYNPGFGPTITAPFGTRYLFAPATCGPQLATGVYYPAGTGFMLVYQDVTVPAGNSVTLKFSETLWEQLNFYTAPDWRAARPQNYIVQIRNTSNVVLQTLLTVTAPANTLTNIPWTNHTFVLGPAYAGQTIRLAFVFTTETGLTGPGNCGIDGVSMDAAVPTAADASVTGRILTDTGRGISRASLSITDSQTGERKYAITNQFGYYNFDGLETGRFYILNVRSKRYTFQQGSQSFQLDGNLDGVDFTANPLE